MELDSDVVVNVPQMIKVILRAVNIHRNMVEIAFEWFQGRKKCYLKGFHELPMTSLNCMQVKIITAVHGPILIIWGTPSSNQTMSKFDTVVASKYKWTILSCFHMKL